jgi:hypothetical protein
MKFITANLKSTARAADPGLTLIAACVLAAVTFVIATGAL